MEEEQEYTDGVREDDNAVKSGVEFMAVLGYVFLVLGFIGFIVSLISFDWEAYNEVSQFSYSNSEELELMKPDLIITIALASASLLINGAIGAFFIAFDKVALTLKKIQLGIKE